MRELYRVVGNGFWPFKSRENIYEVGVYALEEDNAIGIPVKTFSDDTWFGYKVK
jgi:hypothetical protein